MGSIFPPLLKNSISSAKPILALLFQSPYLSFHPDFVTFLQRVGRIPSIGENIFLNTKFCTTWQIVTPFVNIYWFCYLLYY